jgi:hypothetical protein
MNTSREPVRRAIPGSIEQRESERPGDGGPVRVGWAADTHRPFFSFD